MLHLPLHVTSAVTNTGTPKNRASGEKGLGTTLKKVKSLCFNDHIHIPASVKLFTQCFGWGAAKSHGTFEGAAG